jgi:hypothetical protein
MTHTPGPWTIDHQRIGPPGEPVALLCDVNDPMSGTVIDIDEGICTKCGGDDVECLNECTLHKCVDCNHALMSIDDAENEANARLIASAPDLLSALTALVESIENVNFGVHDDDGRTYDAIPWAQAEAAIAKATGQEEEL